MATTISGHTALRSIDPRLAKRYVPGRPVWFKTHRAYLPLFLRLGVLLDQTIPLRVSDTWSHNYRETRITRGKISDHAGYAIDVWSSREGAQGRPPSPGLRKAVHDILDVFTTADGRRVFQWGGDYKNVPDVMHFNVAPGITTKDAAAVIKRLRLLSDGTVK